MVLRDRPALKNNGFLEIAIFRKSSRAKGYRTFWPDALHNRPDGGGYGIIKAVIAVRPLRHLPETDLP